MLNGKFYMGLPPRMIERKNIATTNRQESHFFWPDDTDTESAVETQVRRRASLSVSPAERPVIARRESNSGTDTSNELDTKQMLRKEFAKSSIQFMDNICEEDETNAQQRRKPFLLRNTRKEITSKPTATRLELPNSDTDMAASKKKNVYESKVEFFDYVDDDAQKRNNLRKIDMNDKKEMEKNSKNSPKLQNKCNVNNYIEQKSQNSYNEEQEGNSKVRMRDEDLPRGRAKSVETKSRHNKYRRDQTPKRILKNSIRNGIDYSDYPECCDDEDFDLLTETIKNVKLNSRRPPRKQVSYSEEEEDIPVRNYMKTNNYCNNNNSNNNDKNNYVDDLNNHKHLNQYKYRNAHNQRSNAESHRRQHQRFSSPENDYSDFEQDQYMAVNKNNNNNNNYNKSKQTEIETPPPSAVAVAAKKSTTLDRPINVAQMHLRSSLCFHDGEIVGSDNEAMSTAMHPQRRNARNAATRRVSVGLPD